MTKTAKRVLALLLVFSMAVIAPVKVDAKTIKDTTEVVILYPKTSPDYGVKYGFEYTTMKQKPKDIKVSNQSVAKITCVKEKKGSYRFYVTPKKAGSVNLTYKLGKVTHKVKVSVRKYINPYKKITINGKDITSKFKKTNVCNLSYKQYKGKNVTISYKRKAYWTILHVDYLTKSDKLIECLGSTMPGDKEKFKVTRKGSYVSLYTEETMDEEAPYEMCEIHFK